MVWISRDRFPQNLEGQNLDGQGPGDEVSIDPFADVREAAEQGNAAAQAQLLVLSALRETISECRTDEVTPIGPSTEPSATEYLAAVLPPLRGLDKSHMPQLIAILAAVIPYTNRSLLRHKFPAIAAVLTTLLKERIPDATNTGAAGSAAPSSEVTERLLKCLGHLLAVQESSAAVWSMPGVLKAFHPLLLFLSDERSKVRRAAHEAVAEILASQVPAITKTHGKGPAAQVMDFCRAVAAGCTSQDVSGALYLLQFMRLSVPLLPPSHASNQFDLILGLLPLGSPAVTAAVMQTLSAIVQSPRACVTASTLSRLMRELLARQPSRTAGAGAVSYALLLASCLLRLQSLDSEAASTLLPRATVALVDYCESSSPSVHTSSCGAINLMFQACVDQAMVTQMAGSLGRGHAPAGPLAATLSALQSLLQYRFQSSWPKSLPLLGRLFLHLRGASYPLLVGVLRGLGELHDALTSVPTAALPTVTAALNEAVGFAIEGMGAERVLEVLPLIQPGPTGTALRGFPESRAWLLPLLTEHTRAAPSRLAFFQEYVLATAKSCDSAAKSGRLGANATQTQRFRVEQLWGLLPGFCAKPSDIASAFGSMAPILANAMQDANYPGILLHVCAGLQALVEGAQARTKPGRDNGCARADLEKLSNTATRFLPKLFALIVPSDSDAAAGAVADDGPTETTNERTSAVCGAAAAMASVAPPAFLTGLFKKLLHKLIQATAAGGPDRGGENDKNSPAGQQRAQVLLDLAAALTPHLPDEDVSLLYRTAKPLVRDDASPQLQKRAYKVLLALCTHQAGFMASPDQLADTLELFTTSLLTCHVSARVMRLQCLSRLTASFTPGDESQARFLPAATLEVVLCTKDSNGKTRELAYSVLVSLATARGNPADTVRTVVGAFAAATPHARSAAVLALAHLQLEFGHFRSERWDARVAGLVPELTRTMLLLLKEPSREVVKAVLGWLRVGIGGADREVLRPMIGDIVLGVMSGTTPRHKDHFRAKIRVVLSKLCRKFGFAEIKELMPEQDKKLIAHMQATAEREIKAKKIRLAGRDNAEVDSRASADRARTRGENAEAGICKALRKFDAMMDDSDTEEGWDSDEDHSRTAEAATQASGLSRRRGPGAGEMMVRERGEDGTSVVDLLDPAMVRNMRVAKRGAVGMNNSDAEDDDSDGDEGPELTLRDGKLVIPGTSDDSEDDSDSDIDSRDQRKKKGSRGGGAGGDSDGEGDMVDTGKNEDGFVHMQGRRARARAASEVDAKGMQGRGQAGRGHAAGRGGLVAKRQKVDAVKGTASGAEFRSKKAGGDVKRKGAVLEPYAYIPLDGRTLTSKKAGNTVIEQYGAVVGTVRGAKKGYQKRRGGQHR